MNMDEPARIRWCEDPLRAGELAAFFAGNVEPAYISHSELQGPRALSPSEWQPGLEAIIEKELSARLAESSNAQGPTAVDRPVLTAEQDGKLIALALVTFAGDAPVPFAVLEDIVVAPPCRNFGIGRHIVDWIAAEARARGCLRLFLESGIGNHRAHDFFERAGFAACSIVMMKPLERPGS